MKRGLDEEEKAIVAEIIAEIRKKIEEVEEEKERQYLEEFKP